MRTRAFACVTAVVGVGLFLAVSGCTPFANKDLKRVVEAAFLPGMDKHNCEWGSSSFESEPKSWYGCWDYTRGSAGSIGLSIGAQLRSVGFDVAGAVDGSTVELTAVRGSNGSVDLLPYGFTHGRNTSPAEVTLSPGDVFVDVWAAEPRSSSDAEVCAELPRWPDE